VSFLSDRGWEFPDEGMRGACAARRKAIFCLVLDARGRRFGFLSTDTYPATEATCTDKGRIIRAKLTRSRGLEPAGGKGNLLRCFPVR
jgi:hypothetical protein